MLPVVKSIDPNFRRWLIDTLQYRGTYTIDKLTQQVPAEELFEALVPENNWDVLRDASKLMEEKISQRNYVHLTNNINDYNGSTIEMYIEFNHGLSKPLILLPAKLNPLTPQSKLMEYLTPSLTITKDWITLVHVVVELINMTNNREILANTFPWLPDIIRESGWILIPDETAKQVNTERLNERIKWYKNEIGITNKADRYNCDRTFIAALKRLQPAPFLHAKVREVILSGSRLLTQYRLTKQIIEEGKTGPILSTIKPAFNSNLIHPNVISGLQQTKELYKYERG